MEYLKKLVTKDKGGGDNEETVVPPSIVIKSTTNAPKNLNLLVIDSDEKDWVKLFDGCVTASGRTIQVTKCRWESMVVTADRTKAIVYIKPNESPIRPEEGVNRTCIPDFILVRKLVRGLNEHHDYSNALYGLLFAGIPAINSIESVWQCLERPVVNAALNKLWAIHKHKFPFIDQNYYSHATPQAMLFTPSLPVVVKVGYAEAGYGKMRFENSTDFNDFKGVLALHNDYVTVESYIDNREYDLRIQKIGNHYRAYKRFNPNWKGNVGSSIVEEIPMTEEFTFWASECGKLFGGMEILTVDAIHTKDGKDYILEINDTASGLHTPNEQADLIHIRDLCLEKINLLQL